MKKNRVRKSRDTAPLILNFLRQSFVNSHFSVLEGVYKKSNILSALILNCHCFTVLKIRFIITFGSQCRWKITVWAKVFVRHCVQWYSVYSTLRALGLTVVVCPNHHHRKLGTTSTKNTHTWYTHNHTWYHPSSSHTARKFNWWRYCLAVWDKFSTISLYLMKLTAQRALK